MLNPAPKLKKEYEETLEAYGHMSPEFREGLIAATLQKKTRDDWDDVKLYDLIQRNAAHLPDPKTRHMSLLEQRLRIDTLKAIDKRSAKQEQALQYLYEYGQPDDELLDPRLSQRELRKINLICGNN